MAGNELVAREHAQAVELGEHADESGVGWNGDSLADVDDSAAVHDDGAVFDDPMGHREDPPSLEGHRICLGLDLGHRPRTQCAESQEE